jgi:hypothetical protein
LLTVWAGAPSPASWHAQVSAGTRTGLAGTRTTWPARLRSRRHDRGPPARLWSGRHTCGLWPTRPRSGQHTYRLAGTTTASPARLQCHRHAYGLGRARSWPCSPLGCARRSCCAHRWVVFAVLAGAFAVLAGAVHGRGRHAYGLAALTVLGVGDRRCRCAQSLVPARRGWRCRHLGLVGWWAAALGCWCGGDRACGWGVRFPGPRAVPRGRV